MARASLLTVSVLSLSLLMGWNMISIWCRALILKLENPKGKQLGKPARGVQITQHQPLSHGPRARVQFSPFSSRWCYSTVIGAQAAAPISQLQGSPTRRW